tara:strand:+ start:2697 stop:3344 length:648 start_codon:yes stop_codon:yes gene_type:complete
MNTKNDSYNRLVSLGKDLYGVEILFKNESLLMKALSIILFFNKRFMTGYITVIGKKVYFPSREWLNNHRESAARSLCHEFVHISDEMCVGPIAYRLSYLFPQWLSIFAFSSIFVGPWALVFLLFLLPLPAPFRAFWEIRGYAMTDAVFFAEFRQFSDFNFLEKQFIGPGYYYMWPFRQSLREEIRKNRNLIKLEKIEKKIVDASKILGAYAGKSD